MHKNNENLIGSIHIQNESDESDESDKLSKETN